MSFSEIAYEQLKAGAGVLVYSNAEFKGIISVKHQRDENEAMNFFKTLLKNFSEYLFQSPLEVNVEIAVV